MREVVYKKKKFEYDETALNRYSVARGLALGQQDPSGFFEALSTIFAGRDREYAEMLGDSTDELAALLEVVTTDAGSEAKN